MNVQACLPQPMTNLRILKQFLVPLHHDFTKNKKKVVKSLPLCLDSKYKFLVNSHFLAFVSQLRIKKPNSFVFKIIRFS